LAITKVGVNHEAELRARTISSSESAGFNGKTNLSGVTSLYGTLSLGNGTIQWSDGVHPQGSKQPIPSITPINIKYENYTISSLSDRDSILETRMLVSNTITVQQDAVINFPVGTTIDIVQAGTGQTTIVAAEGVSMNFTPGRQLRQQWSVATLLKRDANTWLLFGDLTA
jgi:hypothetical protein